MLIIKNLIWPNILMNNKYNTYVNTKNYCLKMI